MRRLSGDERTRDLYERHEKARRDIESQTRWARKEVTVEIARNMMADGEPVEKITRYTGLTREEVETLLQ